MKTIRAWVYALLKYKENIVVILKKRWPFTGMYDLPGGKIEHWENHISALKRELEEETGYIGDLIPIGAVYTSPGFCNELIHLYIAKNLVKTKQHLDEGEFLNVVSIPLEEIWKLIKQGQITDAKTLAAFTLAKEHLWNL